MSSALLSLSPHPTARNTARTTRGVDAGSKLLAEHALCLVVLPKEKGRRCDACCRRHGPGGSLRRCTGCAQYWYCGERCQTEHWKTEHKALCSELARYTASNAYSILDEREEMDTLLLSSLITRVVLSGRTNELLRLLGDDVGEGSSKDATLDNADPLATFADLLPFSNDLSHISVPPICPLSPKVRRKQQVPSEANAAALYARFSNNNFVIHAEDLSAIAHGIFPRASRMFNHSCTSNAWVVYEFREGLGVTASVRAGRALARDEEITVPYLDPALPYKRRQEICRHSYGFTCTCQSCVLSERWDKSDGISHPPEDASERASLDASLYHFAFQLSQSNLPLSALSFPHRPAWPTSQRLPSLPRLLLPVLHESYLPSLSSAFRTAAHDGPIEEALRTGRALLALYMVVYPPMYLQSALHCLELCKVSWNATFKLPDEEVVAVAENLKVDAKHYLAMAKQALSLCGYSDEYSGGDEEGPRAEVEVLERLLTEG